MGDLLYSSLPNGYHYQPVGPCVGDPWVSKECTVLQGPGPETQGFMEETESQGREVVLADVSGLDVKEADGVLARLREPVEEPLDLDHHRVTSRDRTVVEHLVVRYPLV